MRQASLFRLVPADAVLEAGPDRPRGAYAFAHDSLLFHDLISAERGETWDKVKKAGRYPDLFLSLKALTASTSVVSRLANDNYAARRLSAEFLPDFLSRTMS